MKLLTISLLRKVKQKAVQSERIFMKLLCLIPVIIITQAVSGQPVNSPSVTNFIGAELIANVVAQGKVKVILKTFYTVAQSEVPETETVSIIGGKMITAGKGIELKKENDYIDVNYPVIPGGKENIPPAVKSVTYTSVIDLGSSQASYDVMWKLSGIPALLNNVETEAADAIFLAAHIDNSQKAINNTSPMLEHLPAFKVSSTTQTTSQMIVRDNDGADKVEVLLSPAMIFDASKGAKQEKGSPIKSGQLTEIKYRKGFSADKPFAETGTFNKKNNEFVFERPGFGNYLCAITITDVRDQKPLSKHPAIFIITSVL